MLHVLRTRQLIRSDLETVWAFISSPGNLSRITPSYMNFRIREGSPGDKEMYAGQIIEYTVSPVAGIPLGWVTEITHVKEQSFFVDEQRFGPYAFWHHKHFIREVPEGVEMTDIVHYKLPLGFIGKLINLFYVRKKLKEIFDYRFERVNAIFNS